MVGNVATVGRSGVHDYILVRASAIILTLYTLLLAGFFITTSIVTFDIWLATLCSAELTHHFALRYEHLAAHSPILAHEFRVPQPPYRAVGRYPMA